MRQAIDKLATGTLRFLLPLTAFLLPLFFLPVTTDFFLINKSLLIFIAGSLSLLAWLIRNITRRHIHLSLSPALLPLIFLSLVYLTSSIIQSQNTYMSLMGRTATIVALTFLFIGVTSSQKNKQVLDLTFAALIISAVLVSLISLYLYLGFSLFPDAPSWLTAKTFNPVGGPVPFLTFVIPLIPVTFYLALKSSRFIMKTTLLLTTLLFVGASLSQIELLLPSSGNQIFILPLSAGWFIAVDIFKNLRTALLGVGPENFLTAFTRLKPLYLNLTPLWDSRFNSSSNELFTILTTTGILGIIFWLTTFFRSINVSLKQINAKKSSTSINASLLLLAGTFLATLIVPANPTLLGLCFIALILVSLSLKLETNVVKDVNIDLSATSEEDREEQKILPWLAALIFIPILFAFWYYSVRAYAANLATFKALSMINKNATESYNQQIKAYNLEPNNPYYHMNFAQTSLALANSIASQKTLSDQDKTNVTQLVQQSIREAKRASELDPANVLTWENLAATYRQLINFAAGASDWAIASYGQAISLDPNNARLSLELGSIYSALKDLNSAQKLYEQAINLKPDWANAHYNLAQIMKAKKDYSEAVAQMRIVIQLLDPNSKDYQTAQNELTELSKLAPAPTPSDQTNNEQAPALTTPTPLPSLKTRVTLPQESAPNLPSN